MSFVVAIFFNLVHKVLKNKSPLVISIYSLFTHSFNSSVLSTERRVNYVSLLNILSKLLTSAVSS